MRGLVLASLLPGLAGCGFFDFEEREPWRAQAEAACYARKLVTPSSIARPLSEIEGPGICGVERPLKVSASLGGAVEITPAATLDCPMTATVEHWVKTVVQPAAYERYGVPVVSIRNMGSYGCRSRNHVKGAKLSEHAFANALDIGGFTLANGHTVTIRTGWRRGSDADKAFLKQVHHAPAARSRPCSAPAPRTACTRITCIWTLPATARRTTPTAGRSPCCRPRPVRRCIRPHRARRTFRSQRSRPPVPCPRRPWRDSRCPRRSRPSGATSIPPTSISAPFPIRHSRHRFNPHIPSPTMPSRCRRRPWHRLRLPGIRDCRRPMSARRPSSGSAACSRPCPAKQAAT
nr:extensin family protein [Methylobrevis pamukkalensis]